MQGHYDVLKLKHEKEWNDPNAAKMIAGDISSYCKQFSIDKPYIQTFVFYMRNKKIDHIQDVFKGDEKLKLLQEVLFQYPD